ncbi:iron-sulfur cluster assembly scaffold protein [Candidatus Saccharibacteria bacterium]|nr:iron-sulfur cluster assembly scaffold protein [Candidatus Saccharibacteria bacterium]
MTQNSCENTPFVYSDLVKEHFLNPKNFLMGDEKKYPHDAEGIVGNPICGDQMKMFLKIDQKTEKIVDLKWKTYGCASAIASTSALSELAKGKTMNEALKIGPDEIAEFLGGLPKHKFHCSVLGHEALAAAIENYHKKNGGQPQSAPKGEKN